jgi:hypothetical protein
MLSHIHSTALDLCNTCEQAGACVEAAEALKITAEEEEEGAAAVNNN